MPSYDNIYAGVKFGEETKKIIESNASFLINYEMLKNIALSRFEYDNLPSSMDARYLELTLYNSGKACAINHKDLGWINTRCYPNGDLNLYEYNKSYLASSVIEEYGTYSIDSPDFCLCLNNLLMTPTDLMIRYYCYLLFMIDCATNTNISLQKFSAIFLTDEKSRLSMENIMRKWEFNTPLILGDKKNLGDLKECLQKVDLNIPFIADKLYEHKIKIINEVLTYLGVNNNPIEKKERLVTDEVNANNDYVASNMIVWTKPRINFCDEFYKKSGIKITLRLSEDVKGMAETWQNTQLQSMS